MEDLARHTNLYLVLYLEACCLVHWKAVWLSIGVGDLMILDRNQS